MSFSRPLATPSIFTNTLRLLAKNANVSISTSIPSTTAYRFYSVSLPSSVKYLSLHNNNARLFSSSSTPPHSPSTQTPATADHHHTEVQHAHHDAHHGHDAEPPKETPAQRETRMTKWYTPKGMFFRVVRTRFYRIALPTIALVIVVMFVMPAYLGSKFVPPSMYQLAMEKIVTKGGYQPIPWVTTFPVTAEELRRRELVEVVGKALPVLNDNSEFKEKLRTSRLEDLEKTVEVLKRLQSENRRFHHITEEEIDQLEQDMYNKYKDFRVEHVTRWDDDKIEAFAHELNAYYRRMRRLRRTPTFVLE